MPQRFLVGPDSIAVLSFWFGVNEEGSHAEARRSQSKTLPSRPLRLGVRPLHLVKVLLPRVAGKVRAGQSELVRHSLTYYYYSDDIETSKPRRYAGAGFVCSLGTHRMRKFFVHDGYSGWSYGTPCDPQLISVADAHHLMLLAGLGMAQVRQVCPPAQYAEREDPLFAITGGNRFLCWGNIDACADTRIDKSTEPLLIKW